MDYWKTSLCECGACKVYGKNCKDYFHADWCPMYRSLEDVEKEDKTKCNCGAPTDWSHYPTCPKSK
jgi:hypothetical protein